MDDILRDRIKELAKKKDIIAKRIKNERKKLKLTQDELGEQLAKLFGEDPYRQSTISAWEKGSSLPPIEKLIALAQLFECDVSYLLGDTDDRRVGNTDVASYTGLAPEVTERLHNTIATDKKFWLAGAFLNYLIALLNLEKIGDSFDNMGMVFMNSLDAVADEILQGKKPLGEIKHILTKHPQVISGGMVKLSPQAAYEFLMNQVSDELKAAGGKATDTLASALMYASYKDMDDETTKNRPGATNTETANDQD